MCIRDSHSEYSTKGLLFKNVTFEVEEDVPTWRTSQFFPPKGNAFLLKIWIGKYVKDIMAYIVKEGKPDLIHAHSYLAASVCASLQAKVKVPFIYTERLSGFVLQKIPKHHYSIDVYKRQDHTCLDGRGVSEKWR